MNTHVLNNLRASAFICGSLVFEDFAATLAGADKEGQGVDTFVSTETLIIELLLIATLVAIAVRRLRVPYTVALVVVGLALTFNTNLQINLTPEIILALFVPPLVFEAAFHLDVRRLRATLPAVLFLAVPGVLLTTAIVGGIVAFGVGISLGAGLVFGALIAATDPVAVVALFRTLGVPKQLAVTVEGESLLNDGTAIVVYNIVLATALGTAASSSGVDRTVDLLAAVINFVIVSAGGALVGVVLGLMVSQLTARIDDFLIETTLTTVLAFGAYLLAEQLHVSGVLAVVGAGITCGTWGLQRMSPTTRIGLFNFWEYLAFVANSLVFLLIGLDVDIRQLIGQPWPVLVAIVAVLASRVVVIYGVGWVVSKFRRGLPMAYRHVLFWGGLRGAISLALALSLPAEFPQRDLLLLMAFGVVLFTLLIQGTSMQILLDRLGLTQRSEIQQAYEREHGKLMAARAAHERLHSLYRSGVLSTATWEDIEPELSRNIQGATDAQRDLLQQYPLLQQEALQDARREGLRAQRAALQTLANDGMISDGVYEELVTPIDAALTGEASELQSFAPPAPKDKHHG